jgi:hypothetical protein
MTKINILSLRNVEKWPSYHIVYEWEDELAKILHADIVNEYKNYKFYKSTLLRLIHLISYRFKHKPKNTLNVYFEMAPKKIIRKGPFHFNINPFNNKNYIPIFIDCIIDENKLEDFYLSYNRCSMLLISDKNIYDLLIKKKCPFKIYHFPLSLPDKYKLNTQINYDKIYDAIIIGRKDPTFIEWLNKYSSNNPDFIYLHQIKGEKGELYYIDNKGNIIGNYHTREQYIDLLRKTRISFYSTPGIDNEKNIDPVTPRLFELMSAQCKLIVRYSDNADTRFFELGKIFKSINNYEDFEKQMNIFLTSETYPKSEYVEFLSKNYTSERAQLLINIISEYEK